MRVQNVNQPQRSQKSKNQSTAFQQNIYGKFSTACKEGEMCPPVILITFQKLKNQVFKAIEAGKIETKNLMGFAEKNDGKTIEIVAIDKTTKLGKDLLEDPSSLEKNLKNIESDPETEILSVEKIKECE